MAPCCFCIVSSILYCLSVEDKTRVFSVPQGNDHICSSALSPCGSWLAYSTLSGVRLYRLQYNNIGITKVGTTTLQLLHRLAYRISSHSKASGFIQYNLTFQLHWSLCFSHQVPKLPKELRSAHHLCFSSDSSKLFASSSHSSVVVTSLDQLECKYIHTLKPKTG